jgi:hypothetical protein
VLKNVPMVQTWLSTVRATGLREKKKANTRTTAGPSTSLRSG